MRVRFIGRILTLVVSFAYFCHTLAQTSGLPDPSPEVRRQEQRQEQLRRELEIRPDVQLGEMPTASLALLP
jgi:hypothetical protein